LFLQMIKCFNRQSGSTSRGYETRISKGRSG
jgi:hypothetical protein